MKSKSVSPVFVGLLLAFCGSVFIFLGWWGLWEDYQFTESVGRSTATIERLAAVSSGRHGTSYEATLSFAIGQESVSEVSTRIAPGTFYRLHTGDRVAVEYLSNQPIQARLAEKSEEDWHWQHDETGLGVGVFFTTVGLLIVWLGRRYKQVGRS